MGDEFGNPVDVGAIGYTFDCGFPDAGYLLLMTFSVAM
jgi:hypothetical protein